jgi:hypothetical protein
MSDTTETATNYNFADLLEFLYIQLHGNTRYMTAQVVMLVAAPVQQCLHGQLK